MCLWHAMQYSTHAQQNIQCWNNSGLIQFYSDSVLLIPFQLILILLEINAKVWIVCCCFYIYPKHFQSMYRHVTAWILIRDDSVRSYWLIKWVSFSDLILKQSTVCQIMTWGKHREQALSGHADSKDCLVLHSEQRGVVPYQEEKNYFFLFCWVIS